MSPARDADSLCNVVSGPVSDRCPLTARGSAAAGAGPQRIALPLRRDAGKLAFTLEDVLSPAECEGLVCAAESLGFAAAGLGAGGAQLVRKQFRDSGRIISEDPLLAQQLFERLRSHLPAVWYGRRLLGLNEQLKFLRYHPGQRFAAHYDGAFSRPGTRNRTCLTLQLYLSQGHVAGGATKFVGHDDSTGVRCEPLPGRALIFQHNILHEGEEVTEGVKYTIRTDVEYASESWDARVQELVGLGGPPRERRRRCGALLSVAAATLCVLCWLRHAGP